MTEGRRELDIQTELRCILLLGFFAFCFIMSAHAQNTSNKGKDFWLGYGNHVGSANRKMSLYITSDVSTSGKVEVPGVGFSQAFNVTANSVTEVTVPQSAFLSGEGKYNRGIHVTAEKPVVVYAHIYDQRVSGASLVLPTTALGKEYYSINYKQISNEDKSSSYFFVVATEDNTEVEITPSAKTLEGKPAGIPFTVNLSRGEVYQVLGEATGRQNLGQGLTNYFGADLTGSKIRSVSSGTEDCKRIAVFSGSGKIGIGCRPGGIGSSDNLYQQVYPTATWGKKFIAVPMASRNYDVIRILKSDPASEVRLNGEVINTASFVNNFYYEFSTQDVNTIEADKPIQVVQYAVSLSQGFNCTVSLEAYGDPEMIFLNPLEQSIDDITVYSPSAFDIKLHYINVVMRTEAVPSFKLDTASQEQYFRKLTGSEEYSYAQIPVPAAGVHHLSANQGFNAIAYGFGNAESYGYSAGTNLKGMRILVEDRLSKRPVTSGCAGADLSFRIDLAYPASRITWDFKNGVAPIVRQYLQADSSYVLNGSTFYVYNLDEIVIFPASKDYEVEIKVDKIFPDGCGNSEFILFDFSVYSSPVPDFSAVSACEGEALGFTDLTDSKGSAVKKWRWEFGDGGTSEEQHPSHIYTEGKDYTVTLTVSNNTGCNPVSFSKLVHVNKKPVPDFSFTGSCAGEVYRFTDKSGSEDSDIKTRVWDMGDGTVYTKADPAPFDHVYTTPGEYSVRLSIVTGTACEETLERKVMVHHLPVADFILPKACAEDTFAEFINKSVIPQGSGNKPSYHWIFGDPLANAANPNTSTAEHPRHVYKTAGTYSVSLTVSSESGCNSSVTKMLTINGSNPLAGFKLANTGPQCSNQPVYFINTASVNGFGSVTKIEWYFDWENEPAAKITDDDPQSGKLYSHQYPIFHTGPPKTVKVKQVVYSGTVCKDETIKEVVLKPAADIDFFLPEEICAEASSVQVTGEHSGLPGKGSFSGRGISASGLFRPGLAGPGKHEITYTFEAENKCLVSISKTINVIPSPMLDAGEDKVIIAFGETVLKPVVSGTVISYRWTPTLGLSNDTVATPLASPMSDITYTLTVTTDKGCTASDDVRVEVMGSPEIPNTFTPNGDGVNDTWVIKYLETLPKCSINVFNRLGQSVFSSRGYEQPWDGKVNNRSLPDGVYYYVLDPGNGKPPLSGSLTILR